MVKDKELERLRKEIAETKKELSQKRAISEQINVKQALKRELFELKNPKKFTLGRRLKKGLKITGSKVGRALLKQARLIKEQQLRKSSVQKRIQKVTKRKLPKLTKRRKSSGGADFFAPLDF